MSFAAELRMAKTVILKQKQDAARRAAIEIFQEVVNGSPFDTGRFRGNWQITINRPSRKKLDRLDPTGAQANADIAETLVNEPAVFDTVFWLVNNLPYAERLEMGWSEQAPQGMVRLAVAKFQDIVKRYDT